MAIWRIPRAMSELGKTRTPFYNDLKAGLLPPLIKLGPRAVGVPSNEIEAIARARIAGKTDEEIRALVRKLQAARMEAAT